MARILDYYKIGVIYNNHELNQYKSCDDAYINAIEEPAYIDKCDSWYFEDKDGIKFYIRNDAIVEISWMPVFKHQQ